MDEIAVGVSIGVSIAAILSAIAVALINNHYQAKLRQQELNHSLKVKENELLHEQEIKKLELVGDVNKRNFEILYCDKRDAFNHFLQVAGCYTKTFAEMQQLSSAASAVILFASSQTQKEVDEFVSFVQEEQKDKSYAETYWFLLSSLAKALNTELQHTYESNCTNTPD